MENSEVHWRDVKGYEGIYQISDTGQVKSLSRLRSCNGVLMRVHERLLVGCLKGDKVKYRSVQLCKDGVKTSHKVHHLVLIAFKGEKPFKGAVARHLNDNPLDNRACNLEWGTTSENTKDKYLNGFKGRVCVTDEVARLILKDARSQRVIAKEYGISQTTVGKIKRGVGYYGKL